MDDSDFLSARMLLQVPVSLELNVNDPAEFNGKSIFQHRED